MTLPLFIAILSSDNKEMTSDCTQRKLRNDRKCQLIARAQWPIRKMKYQGLFNYVNEMPTIPSIVKECHDFMTCKISQHGALKDT